MDTENKGLNDNGLKKEETALLGLPVSENKTFLTHTMAEDMAAAKIKGGGIGGNAPAPEKPFERHIPPPPAPPLSQIDPFRESLDAKQTERDQPSALNEKSGKEGDKKFQIFIPQKKGGFGAGTVILSVILLILLGGGGFMYYWFFIKKTPEYIQIAPLKPEPPIQPVIIEPPQEEPTPPQEPTPTIEPSQEPITIIELPQLATSTPPIVILPPQEITPQPVVKPVIAEPALPQSILAYDRTVVITLATATDTDAWIKIALENVKIAEDRVAVRYLFKLSTDTEKRFLTQKETAPLLGLALPAEYWKQSAAMEFVGYKNRGSFRYGFASSITDKTAMQNIARAWEASVIDRDNLKSLYVEKQYVKPVAMRFLSNTHLGFAKRYSNMPTPDVSLDYAVSNKYFILATSKEMMYAILDKTQAPASPASD